MKIISAIFALIILVPVVGFALSNRQDVSVALWPLNGTAQMPLYLLALVPLAFGLIFGGIWGWACGVPHRLKARRLNKELVALNDRIGELQSAAIIQQAQAVPKKHFWERKS